MTNVLSEIDEKVFFITLNRTEKYNAFDEALLKELEELIIMANANPHINVIVLKANGKHFSAGADLKWMAKVAEYSEEENIKDAQILASLMFNLYSSSKPTLAMIHGNTFGGGLGLIGACDIAIASQDAKFAFSEVKLGLIPAVISPYIINAIGQRESLSLFLSAETFSATKAYEIGLVHYLQNEKDLFNFTRNFAQKIANFPPGAIKACKKLVRDVASQEIDKNLINYTATLIAKQRSSIEAKIGIENFLAKK